MGTINIPLPSNPKSPQRDQEPLQPGGTQESGANRKPEQTRPNPQPPDIEKDEPHNR